MIANRIAGIDLRRSVLVGTSTATGCGRPGSAELTADGDRLTVRFRHEPPPPPECFAPFWSVAIFAVPRERLPDRPRFGDSGPAADPAGPGERVIFMKVPNVRMAAGAAKRADVSEPGALAEFARNYPGMSVERIRGAARAQRRRSPTEQRLFAFRLDGCRLTSADLLVAPRGLSALPIGGGRSRCVQAEHYVAVFALRGVEVPDRPLG